MFSEKLKELRKKKGLTQKKLAELLDCDQSMITRWERNECQPTGNIIKQTAIIFDVSTDYLLGIEDDFSENVNHVVTAGLNDKEAEIIKNYRLSNDVGKTAIEITAESFAKKATSISKERRA